MSKVRIRLKAYDHKVLDDTASKIVTTIKRIGGEIVSSPLNENFKQMRDAISMLDQSHSYNSENIDVNIMMASFSEDHIKKLSRILSIETHITDEDKAFRDYMKILKEEIRREKISLTLSSGDVEKLNNILKENN